MAHITLLVEDLREMAGALPGDARYPALELILARGRPAARTFPTANHLRLALFGAKAGGQAPVAALTHIAESESVPGTDSYWLRADPVSMRADMARVFIVAVGMEGLDGDQRSAFDRVVRDVLAYEGIEVPDGQAGPWCFPLADDPEIYFTALHEALGMDVAEALPGLGEASRWKRIMTEIQVELHELDRQAKEPAGANSVWFWGGGRLPKLEGRSFDAVISDDPVSRGLAVMAGSSLLPSVQEARREDSVLIDWMPKTRDAVRECQELDQLSRGLLEKVARGGRLVLEDGGSVSRAVDRSALRRFWRRSKPLGGFFSREGDG